MEKLRGQYVWNIQVDGLESKSGLQDTHSDATRLRALESCFWATAGWSDPWNEPHGSLSILGEWIYMWPKKKKKLLILSRIPCQGQGTILSCSETCPLLWSRARVHCLDSERGSKLSLSDCTVWSGWAESQHKQWIPPWKTMCTPRTTSHRQRNIPYPCGHRSLQSPGLPAPATCTKLCGAQTQGHQWKCGNTQSRPLGTSMGHGREGWG